MQLKTAYRPFLSKYDFTINKFHYTITDVVYRAAASYNFRHQYAEVLSPHNEGIAKCKNPTAKKIAMELGVNYATVESAETQKTMG